MTNKYKLCRVEVTKVSKVQPIGVNGEPYLDTICSYEALDAYEYAIYENLGNDEYEDWDEYAFYGDDFVKARDEYNKLIKKGQ